MKNLKNCSKLIKEYTENAVNIISNLDSIEDDIFAAAEIIIETYRNDGKVLIFGNGGSAADAQHFATELVARFRKDRAPLNAIALTTNSSMLTAIGNDSGFKYIFKRQLEAAARKGDTAVAVSTSGNSENVLEAVKAAKKNKLKIISFVGKNACQLESYSDVVIKPDSSVTSHIQECHLLVYHLLCHIIEEEFF